jgi:predicted nucleotidyltransferase
MNNLSKYLSFGYTNRISKYLSMVLPDRLIFSLFVENHISKKHTIQKNIYNVELQSLKSTNQITKELQDLCNNYNFGKSIMLSVFGSIATEEITNYSDFDGVLIYDEEKFINHISIINLKRLIEKINLTAHLQDCLQHHGILVIGKNELIENSDEVVNNLITESKVINGTSEISLNNHSISDYQSSFKKLTRSIQNKLNQEHIWENQYFFKNMLSELLLLPCSYLQCQNKKYISKKDSFVEIKSKFQPDELALINKLEDIRKNWKQNLINKSDLNKTTIKSIKANSKTQAEFIAILSEIKTDLLFLIKRLESND